MYALITDTGQEKYYDNVTAVTTDRAYICLTLSSHPHKVNFWRGDKRVKVLLAATGEDFTQLLRSTTQMRIECAYCHRELQAGCEPTSHGICPPCLKVEMAKMDEVLPASDPEAITGHGRY